MASFERIINRITGYCDRIAQAGVMAMMLLAVINIILRISPFWKAIAGSYDFTEFIGVTLVAFSLAACAVKRGHIEVEMFVERLPKQAQGAIGAFTGILSVAIFAVITWQLFQFAGDMRSRGETSMTALMPFYPFVYGLTFGVGLLTLVILVRLIRDFQKAVKG